MCFGVCCLDSGSVVWFFYCVKVMCEDCNDGFDFGLVLVVLVGVMMCDCEIVNWLVWNGNYYFIVKLIDFMCYLCWFVIFVGGMVLDLFMGSGSIGKVVVFEGFQFIGIELDFVYVVIVEVCIWVVQFGFLFGDVV